MASPARSSISATLSVMFTASLNLANRAIFGSSQVMIGQRGKLRPNWISLPTYVGAASAPCFHFLLLRGDLLKSYHSVRVLCLLASLRKRKANGLGMMQSNLTKIILDFAAGHSGRFTHSQKPTFLPAAFADSLGMKTSYCLI